MNIRRSNDDFPVKSFIGLVFVAILLKLAFLGLIAWAIVKVVLALT